MRYFSISVANLESTIKSLSFLEVDVRLACWLLAPWARMFLLLEKIYYLLLFLTFWVNSYLFFLKSSPSYWVFLNILEFPLFWCYFYINYVKLYFSFECPIYIFLEYFIVHKFSLQLYFCCFNFALIKMISNFSKFLTRSFANNIKFSYADSITAIKR